MNPNGNCPSCGGPFRGDSSGAFCERCALKAALGNREEEIRRELLQIASTAERRLYLEEACSDDPELRVRVQAWLNGQQGNSEILAESSSEANGRTAPPLIGGRY